MRVLVVEDDAKLVRALSKGLAHEGHLVDAAFTGPDGLAQASEQDYDAIVLDLMLPGMDGFDVCERLRQRGRWTPVLMLTARSEVRDRVRGLDGGADDYLVKPFEFDEMLARLRVLAGRGPAPRGKVLRGGALRMNIDTRTVTRSGRQIELTPREFDLLAALVENAGRPVSRRELVDTVWSDTEVGSPNIVDVYVGYLRKKLDTAGASTIRTVRGKGFMVDLR